jgi:hypothetical protein
VPISVTALGEKELSQLNIDTFEDYLDQLPNVTAGGGGPGQNTIYIRGLASTTPNLTVAGVAGLAPNVAFYLDEQPLAQPGRNLDVYAADMQRIEVLSGPQGTLFGASSQAGVVRLITNKPDLSGFDASFDSSVSFTKSGEESYSVKAMLNVPVTDTFALRGVVFLDDQGGYIDNVAGRRDLSESARFRPQGTVRANGVPVNANRSGFQSTADLSGVTFLEADNAGLVRKDFNDTQYSGFRATALWEITPDWTVTVAHTRQSLETDGVFFADPELGGLDDLEIQRFEDDRLEDDFSNTSWTVEGRIAMLDVVYTGAYTDRDTDQRIDYTDYLFVGQYLPYYICDGSVTYPGAAAPSGTCQEPNLFVTSDSQTQVFTQELRFSTPDTWPVRATVGGFYSDLELKERNDFNYPGNIDAAPFGGFAPNFPFQDAFNTDAGPFPRTASELADLYQRNSEDHYVGQSPSNRHDIESKASRILDHADRDTLMLASSRYQVDGVRFMDDAALLRLFPMERYAIQPNIQARLRAIEAIQIEERRWIAAAVLSGRVSIAQGNLSAANERDKWAEDFWAKQKDDPTFRRLLMVSRIRPDRFQFDLNQRPDVTAWKSALNQKDSGLADGIADEIFVASEQHGRTVAKSELAQDKNTARGAKDIAEEYRKVLFDTLTYHSAELLRKSTGRFRETYRGVAFRDPNAPNSEWEEIKKSYQRVYGKGSWWRV